MSAYLIVNIEKVKDQDRLKEYGEKVADHTAKYGGKLLAASPEPTVLEGSLNSIRTLIIEFPDLASLNGWYEADDYQPLKEIRLSAIESTLSVVDGVD
jgi:uncharacterized protein (DUF1330 family)|tara:strand:- start:5278 stop:5571 length:294 start_codon:yes stop_codon:yes gene_type:complete